MFVKIVEVISNVMGVHLVTALLMVCLVLLYTPTVLRTLAKRDFILRKRYGRVTTNYVIGMLFGVYLAANFLPEIITAIQGVNTSAWTFTGHSGASTIWSIMGLLVVVGLVQQIIE